MKILSAQQLQDADRVTLQEQQIDEAELIERASAAFTGEFMRTFPKTRQVQVFCGPGNNGADGLTIARILFQKGYPVEVYLLKTTPGSKASAAQDKQNRFLPLSHISHIRDFPIIAADFVVIDALFGTGLNRPVTDLAAELIQHINDSLATVVSVDVPSGLFADQQSATPIIAADLTITFESPKLSFFLPHADPYVGDWRVVGIGLDKSFLQNAESEYFVVTRRHVAAKLRPRKRFSHKGEFGTALLIAGSYGMMGAALLAARACLRSGVGKLRVRVPAAGDSIMQMAVPDAMTLPDTDEKALTQLPDLDMFTAIGVGPGLGKDPRTTAVLKELFKTAQVPLVIDADAITLMGSDPELLGLLPPNSILTPHLKEFERLAGPVTDDFARLKQLQDFCRKHQCYVVLKGAYSCTCTPSGACFFNTTGNPGMATGGSGDVLTGIITGLLAQQYSAHEAAVLGVYLHGLAGDIAREQVGTYSLIASDIIISLGDAFLTLKESRSYRF